MGTLTVRISIRDCSIDLWPEMDARPVVGDFIMLNGVEYVVETCRWFQLKEHRMTWALHVLVQRTGRVASA